MSVPPGQPSVPPFGVASVFDHQENGDAVLMTAMNKVTMPDWQGLSKCNHARVSLPDSKRNNEAIGRRPRSGSQGGIQ